MGNGLLRIMVVIKAQRLRIRVLPSAFWSETLDLNATCLPKHHGSYKDLKNCRPASPSECVIDI